MPEDLNKAVCLSCGLMSPIFEVLSDEEYQFFRKISKEAVFDSGEIIFKQGAPLTHIICISSGSAKLYIELMDKNKILLKILLPKNIVGISGLNTDNLHHFSLSALEPINTCFIEIEAFNKVIRQNPAFAFNIIGSINTMHNRLYDKLKTLTQKNINGKVAETLLYLSNEVYCNSRFTTLLSRQDLADMSTTTRESVIRALRDLKDQKIIDFTNNEFEILQKEILEKIHKFG